MKHSVDVFMYIANDILVPYKAIKYWLEYNKKLIEMNYRRPKYHIVYSILFCYV